MTYIYMYFKMHRGKEPCKPDDLSWSSRTHLEASYSRARLQPEHIYGGKGGGDSELVSTDCALIRDMTQYTSNKGTDERQLPNVL